MPEMDGLEATAAIRERERVTGRHIPIVAMTAHAMKGDRERCLAAGMDGYVAKPLRASELFAAIEGVLDPARRVPVNRPHGAIFDEARLLERVGGDRVALARLVELLLADAPRLVQEIRGAAEAKNAVALQAAAHTLKGAVSNFAAPGATKAAARLQQLGESAHLRGARDACTILEKEIDQLRAALSELVAKPPKG